MKPNISRRLFLGGAGTTVALPFLPSAVWSRRASAAVCTPPRRFMAWFIPNGLNMPDWTPSTAGTTWTAPKIAAPLEIVRQKILILTGLDMQATTYPGSPPGDHGAGTGSFLNMIMVQGHETDKTRTSIDQVLLPVLNPVGCTQPLLPSMQLGVQGDNGLCDRVSCDFSRAISWTKGTPMPNIYDPQAAFDRMFAGFTPATATPGAVDLVAAQRKAERKSVLDAVLAQANALTTKLSVSDKNKLDEYTTSVRALETRLDNMGTGSASTVSCKPPARPAASPPLNFDRGVTPSSILSAHTPIFVDLMALAFTCDITRSLTFMLGNGTSNNDFQFVTGSGSPHHGTSHHGGNAAQLAKLTQIGTWEMTQMAALLKKLEDAKEVDGTSVLDNTTFYMGSDVGDGNAHTHWDQPVLLAGKASGKLKVDGRHINYVPTMQFPRPLVGPRGGPHTGRVLIAILQAHGIMVDTFGMATGGPLPELMV